jgi:hypothetical protein
MGHVGLHGRFSDQQTPADRCVRQYLIFVFMAVTSLRTRVLAIHTLGGSRRLRQDSTARYLTLRQLPGISPGGHRRSGNSGSAARDQGFGAPACRPLIPEKRFPNRVLRLPLERRCASASFG